MILFLKVVNWIGIFLLAVGCMISVLNGGFISALFGVLLVSILSSAQIVGNTSKLGMRVPRIAMIKMIARGAGVVGSWLLTIVGGWEYVGGAVVLTGAMLGSAGIKLRRRRRITQDIRSMNNDLSRAAITTSDAPASKAPPEYIASTVQIVADEEKSNANMANNLRIQTPVFNV